MSSISDDDNNSSTLSNHTDRLQPVFPDGTAIIWDGNDAHIAGALFECKRFFTRTGLFKSLIEHRAAPVGKGFLAVKHVQTVPFVMGTSRCVSYCVRDGGRVALRAALTAVSSPVWHGGHRINLRR